jgi:hypothetical protein
MAKKLKWHMSWQEAAPAKKNPGTRLVWLVDGALAKLVVVERQGRGWSTTKHTRVLGLVTIVKVYSQHPQGFCDILRDGKIEQMPNVNLRPMDE